MSRPLAYNPVQSLWLQSQHAVGDIPINQMPLEQSDAVLEYQKAIFKNNTPDIPPVRQGIDRKILSKQVREMVYHRPNPMGCELTVDPNYDYCRQSDKAIWDKRRSFAQSHAQAYLPVGRESHVTNDAVQVKRDTYRWVNEKYSKRLVPDFEPRGIVLNSRKTCDKATRLRCKMKKYNTEEIDEFTKTKEISNKSRVRPQEKHIFYEQDNKRVVDRFSDKTYGLELYHPDVAKAQKKQRKRPKFKGEDGARDAELETGTQGASYKTRGGSDMGYETNYIEPADFDEFTRTTKYRMHNKIQKSVAHGKDIDEELGPKDISLRTTRVYRSDPTERFTGRNKYDEVAEDTEVFVHEALPKKKKAKSERVFGEKLVNRRDGMEGLMDEHSVETTKRGKKYIFKPFAREAMSNLRAVVDERMRHEKQLANNTRFRKKRKIKQIAVNQKHGQDHFDPAKEAFAHTSRSKRFMQHDTETLADKEKIAKSQVHDIQHRGRRRKAYTRRHNRMPAFNNQEDASLSQEVTA